MNFSVFYFVFLIFHFMPSTHFVCSKRLHKSESMSKIFLVCSLHHVSESKPQAVAAYGCRTFLPSPPTDSATILSVVRGEEGAGAGQYLNTICFGDFACSTGLDALQFGLGCSMRHRLGVSLGLGRSN